MFCKRGKRGKIDSRHICNAKHGRYIIRAKTHGLKMQTRKAAQQAQVAMTQFGEKPQFVLRWTLIGALYTNPSRCVLNFSTTSLNSFVQVTVSNSEATFVPTSTAYYNSHHWRRCLRSASNSHENSPQFFFPELFPVIMASLKFASINVH